MHNSVSAKKPLRVALLSSFNATPLCAALQKEAEDTAFPIALYETPYSQYAQEIFNSQSSLYAHAPEVIILFIDVRSMMGELYFRPYAVSLEARKAWVDGKLEEIAQLVAAAHERCNANIIVHNFEVPAHSPMGVMETKQSFGFHEMVRSFNRRLEERYQNDGRVFVYDFDSFASRCGKDELFDHKMYYLGDLKLRHRYVPLLARSYFQFFKPLKTLTKKCLVLDCDNTLWGGVVGEDGLEGIHLGPTPRGKPFWEFQQYIISLFDRGIILAINSKNNPEDALRVFREHPHTVLREKHFAAMRINWDDKVSNLRALAVEINISTDSLVFVDDDPLQCEMVRRLMPEVVVVELPKDPSLFLKTLIDLDVFSTLILTEEDRERGKMYAQEKQRRSLSQALPDLTAYLRSLDMRVSVEPASALTIPRIAQLTQKTNQFNMTTRRYSEEDIMRLSSDSRYHIASLALSDQFGDSGITGSVILALGHHECRIDTFLLSCRVLGRTVENALLAYAIAFSRAYGASVIIGEFQATAKNDPAKGFFQKNGFILRGVRDGVEEWERSTEEAYPYPEVLMVDIKQT